MLILAFIIFILALVMLWQASHRQRTISLPAGRVIYSDTRAWGAVEQPLYDAEVGLVGKPDYLVETGGQIIPVEVKSSPVTTAPYEARTTRLGTFEGGFQNFASLFGEKLRGMGVRIRLGAMLSRLNGIRTGYGCEAMANPKNTIRSW